jgi:hypothetical protein
LTAWRQQEDAARVERRAQENALVTEFDRTQKTIADVGARREDALRDIDQQVTKINETTEAEIAEAEREQTEIILALKQLNVATVVARLLHIPVKRVNRTVAPDRRRSARQNHANAAESRPVGDANTSGGTTRATPPRTTPREGCRPPQGAMFPELDLAPSSFPTTTPDHRQPVNDSRPEEVPPDSAPRGATGL